MRLLPSPDLPAIAAHGGSHEPDWRNGRDSISQRKSDPAMILTFKGAYGSTIDLDRDGEIQGYEFVEPPIEYRFLRAGSPISDWTSPVPGFISLLRPVTINAAVQTRGLDA